MENPDNVSPGAARIALLAIVFLYVQVAVDLHIPAATLPLFAVWLGLIGLTFVWQFIWLHRKWRREDQQRKQSAS